jgi:4-amino-4-deoxy-L-arabinose transferase
MAKKCFNVRVAYFAALLYTLSYYTLNFCTGGEAVDHVDFAFFFYVTASFWAWINYDISKENKWRILVGVFAGLAVLTKWVTGLLVFAGWGIVVLADPEQRRNWASYFTIAKTALISFAIFLPWQIYTFIKFPKEAFHELSYNRRHMFEVIEGHSGSFWYYIERIDENYGWLAPYIIIPALYLAWRKLQPVSSRNFMFAVLFVCYLFFSSCATKMPAFCHPVVSVIFMAMGVFSDYIYNNLRNVLHRFSAYKIFLFLAICFLCFKVFQIDTIRWFHTAQDEGNINRQNQVRFTTYYKKLDKSLPDNVLVFGAPFGTEIEAMFFTGNIIYNKYPDEQKYRELKKNNEKMAVFESPETPVYLLQDSTVKKLVFNY